MAQVTGIGGIFIKFKDPQGMKTWYSDVLGMTSNDYWVLFEFNGNTHPTKGFLQLGTFEASSDYFGDDKQQCMLNFRVDDLQTLKEKISDLGVNIVDEIATYSYGSFLHIEDPEGNRIELWEPIDSEFESTEGSTMKMR